MASISDILLYFNAVDNVTPVAQQINSQVSGGMQDMNRSTGGLIGTVRELSGVFSGLNGLVMGTFGMFGLTNFKQMTYGLATAREELLSLHRATYGQGEASDEMWDKMDRLTNEGYVQLDDLTQVMSNFKMSTGATVEQADKMAETVNKVGNIAILMGKDSYSTMALMQSAVGGVNGQLNMMRIHLGINKERLESFGWSGKASDVEGYISALNKALEQINTKDLLGSTEGKVISLQKRFRIAGRNIGNAMLPPINAILDAVTQLNAMTNDGLATAVILGTGFMSTFASILPTLSPLISIYDILHRRSQEKINAKKMCDPFYQMNQCVMGTNRLLATNQSRLSMITNPIRRVIVAVKDLVAVPIINFLKQIILNHTAWIRTPIVAFLGRVRSSLRLVNLELVAFGRRTNAKILSPFTGALSTLNGKLGQVKQKLIDFILNYSKLETKLKVMDILGDSWQRDGVDIEDVVSKKNEMGVQALFGGKIDSTAPKGKENIVSSMKNLFGIKGETKAIEQNSKSLVKNNLIKSRGIMSTVRSTLARTLGIGALEGEAVATGVATTGFEGMAVAEEFALGPILLIVLAIAGLILLLNEIGKSLGWWEDWKTMLEAITNGVKRLWSAFINNPNVQATIKGLQGFFGQLGGTIQWVAYQVLQFFGWKDDGREVDIVRMIIDAFGTLGRVMGDIVNVFKNVFGAIYTVTAPIVGAIVWVIRSIICILLGCSPGIVPALQRVNDVFRSIWSGLASFITNPIGTILRILQGLTGNFFNIALRMGQSIWNGLNSVLGGIPQKVWQTFWNMLNNLKQIPQMIWGTAQEIGQQAYNGLDSAVSWATGGLVHLPNANNGQQNARQNARTMGNATKNYNNSRNVRGGHTINIGQGAIQLDARNLTTKESKQIMINALEGLTTYETVHTKKAQGGK